MIMNFDWMHISFLESKTELAMSNDGKWHTLDENQLIDSVCVYNILPPCSQCHDGFLAKVFVNILMARKKKLNVFIQVHEEENFVKSIFVIVKMKVIVKSIKHQIKQNASVKLPLLDRFVKFAVNQQLNQLNRKVFNSI